MKKIIVIASFLIAFLFLPNPIFAHDGSHEIKVDETGFSPKELTIDQGDTVTFINSGDELHWPASDIHPTHQVYSEFDPKAGIPAGQSWSFTFTKSGSWRMHDHLFAQNVGKITVQKDSDYAVAEAPPPKISLRAKIKEKIENLKFEILRKYYSLFPSALDKEMANVNIQKIAAGGDESQIKNYLQLMGSKKMMDKLITDSGGGSIVDCHQEAHRLGRIAFQVFGASVFAQGSFDCHSGFIHGAMESFLKEKGTENLSKNIEDLCNTFKTSYGNFECLHGVGHGVMAYVNYDLPEGLETCQQLSSSFEKSSCYGGVFMENIVTAEGNGASSEHETKWVSDDPHFPCNEVSQDPQIQTQCYLMQTSRMLDISNHNFDFVTQNCLTAPQNLISTCFQSEGRDAAGQTLRDPEKIIAICSKVPSDNYVDCVGGALNVIVEFWSDKMEDKPHALCKLVVDAGAKMSCYSLLSSRLEGIYGSDKTKISQSCDYFEPLFRSLCRTENNI